jgi:hypothetical protein
MGKQSALGITLNTDKGKWSTKPDVSLVDNTKSYIIIIVVHTAENIEMVYKSKIQNYIHLVNILYETEVLNGTDKPQNCQKVLCSKDQGHVLKFLNLEESVPQNISSAACLKFAKLSENTCLQ